MFALQAKSLIWLVIKAAQNQVKLNHSFANKHGTKVRESFAHKLLSPAFIYPPALICDTKFFV